MESPTEARGASSPERKSSSAPRSRRRKRLATTAATGLIVFAIALAPLAAGGVHRAVLLVLCPTILLGVAALAFTEWRVGSRFRMSEAAAFPAAFVLLTVMQLIPLPGWIVDRLDPTGAALLADGGGGSGGWRPLSLDPPATWEALLRAVMGFLVFVSVFHLTAKKDGRSWFVRGIAATGVAAVVIGLGHRIFGIPQIYGMYPNTRTLALLIGPFINSNHTAEFLELATFVAIACARQSATQLTKLGWYACAATSAAGALATLSRASLVGLGVGGSVILVAELIDRRLSPTAQTKRGLLPAAVGIIGLILVAASIGAAQLVDRFHGLSLGNETRFRLWRDSLKVLTAHPWGIGRGAFDTVYPVHRTLKVGIPVRFSFVENQPLQMLIDFGYLGFALLAGAAALLVRALIKDGRRDRFELALVAALLAVLGHGLTDFGLETPGVLLPFMAVLATIFGRTYKAREKAQSTLTGGVPSRRFRGRTYLPVAGGLAVGLLALITGANPDFDGPLKAAATPQQLQAVIAEARRAHPVDYYYPLMLSSVEPLFSEDGHHSPRLRVLNQALRLCQNCPEVHLQIARVLWRIGRRSQSITEWSLAVRGQHQSFENSLSELATLGARPDDFSRLAGNDSQRLVDVARFMLLRGYGKQTAPVIDAARVAGAPQLEVLLLRGRMNLADPEKAGAEGELVELKRLAPQDPRVVLLEAEQLEREHADGAGVQALAVVERALDREPNDLDLQRKRLDVVTRFERWSAADRAIAGFKQALQASNRSTVEANVAAARIHMTLGRTRDALAEYRIATTADPENPTLWRQYAETAEAARHYTVARDAYGEVMRLAPARQVSEAMRRLDDLQASERLGAQLPGIGSR